MHYDKDFLLELDKYKNKIIYARITALKFNESPVETIEGRVTQGSINLDGASAVRRSCSLTLVAQNFDYNNYVWGMNTKFRLEIGVNNDIDPTYPEIIWFNQGIYLITSFSVARNTTSFNITIQGKDKMCLLNGEVGGTINVTTDFGKMDEQTTSGYWITKHVLLKDIIKNAVHTYGGEPLHNIIINDLDDLGLELLEYKYENPLYLYRNINGQLYDNMTLDGKKECWYWESIENLPDWLKAILEAAGLSSFGSYHQITLEQLDDTDFEQLTDGLIGSQNPKQLVFSKPEGGFEYNNVIYHNAPSSDKIFIVAKILTGDTVGYRTTDLTYPGDLIANVGENITSVLDKIKNMLGEFEYFYDVDGQFIFQKKQIYINTSTILGSGTETHVSEEGIYNTMGTAYAFSGGELITVFNNNPNLLNLRNDFSVWGSRTGISGIEIPVHMRYAIDEKPVSYTSISITEGSPASAAIAAYNKKYSVNVATSQVSTTYTTAQYDWREIIYRMAHDYFKYAHILDDFTIKVAEANPSLYPFGMTGYEQYYTDIQGFWRELYNPDAVGAAATDDRDQYAENVGNIQLEIADTKSEMAAAQSKLNIAEAELPSKTIESEIVAAEQFIEAQKTIIQTCENTLARLEASLKEAQAQLDKANSGLDTYYPTSSELKYWNRAVYEAPETLNFWLDFLDGGELAQFNVKNTGVRPKAINDTSVKSIYFRETPQVIFVPENASDQSYGAGYSYIQAGAHIDAMFSVSSQGVSAKTKIDELLYKHSYCVESASITTIPIYYLEPNCRIHIHDEETNLDGDYIVSKLTIPLAYNGTMSITATKAVSNII